MNENEILNNARKVIDSSKCKVCPVCNGAVCGGMIPGMGGIGTGAAFRNNYEAWTKRNLVMSVLHDANDPDCSLNIFGQEISMPVMIAPIGDIASQINGGLSIAQYTRAVIDNCMAAQTFASIGDLIGFEPFKSAIDQIKGRAHRVLPFIKTWDDEEFFRKLEIVKEAGCRVVGTDVDSAGLTGLRKSPVHVSVWDERKLKSIVHRVHGFQMKYIVKGIMSLEDAQRAVDCGADAILVSNHGGRVLDFTQGSADVLEKIADKFSKHAEILVDGGIRTGADVLKALALGAKMCLICRPAAISVHGDQLNGLKIYFENIRQELLHAMRMTGCRNLESVSKKVIV